MLDQLLSAAMEKPDMRIDALHNLAIELEHKTQYAVRRRALRKLKYPSRSRTLRRYLEL